MFGKSNKGKNANGEKPKGSSRGIGWEIPILFGIIFALSVAEMCFTIDAFVYLEKKDKWWSSTEKSRMAFLAFSAARSILLSGTYASTSICIRKNIMSTMHTIFLVLSTIFWCISGGLIYQMWQYMECANAGIPDSFSEFESQVEGGMTLCHEIKTIEILAWVIAGVNVLATIPVVKTWMDRRKASRHEKMERAKHEMKA